MVKKIPYKNRIFLAPMEEINDIAFRLLCKKAGAGLTYTGMINPLTKQEFYAISSRLLGNRCSEIRGSLKETSRCLLDDSPVLQLFCNTEKGIKEFMKKYDDKVSMWDFNLGCPAKTAKKHLFGSFMASDLESIEKILKLMRESTKKPVTVKIRKSKYSFKILKIAEKYCDAICIHPRTQSQGYGGKPDLAFAENFKSLSKIPVIYSGNVDENNYSELLKKFDYVMIGRRAMGNPNVFAKISNKKSNLKFQDYLQLAQKYNLPFRQIKFQAMAFTKNLNNAKKLRLKIFKCKTLRGIKEVFFRNSSLNAFIFF